MRLLYANNYLYRRGGSERVMFDEAASFAALGHETLFFGHRHREADRLPFSSLFPEQVDYRRLRGIAKVRAAARIVSNGDARRRFTEMLDTARPSLVHAHNIYAGLTPAILAGAAVARIPAVVTLHDYKLACPSYLMLDRGSVCDACIGSSFLHCVRRRCHKESLTASAVTTVEAIFNAWTGRWDLARVFVCPSAFLRGIMIRHGIPPEKLRHLPNGIDLDQWPVAADGGAYALYVGRLSQEKGVEVLVRASIGTSLPVRIVGNGPEEDRLRRLASDVGANVRFEGHRSPDDVRTILRGAAFLVVPSIWYENAPMTIIEAMAVGKPVVAAEIGGIPEMVEHEATGLLVRPGDVEQLREAMGALAADAARRRAMGAAGRQRAERDFALSVHVERLAAVYDEALAA